MNLFTVLQLIISIILITAILMQSRGTGLGASFGGSGQSFHSKRGFEQVLFRATIVLGVLFLGISFLAIL